MNLTENILTTSATFLDRNGYIQQRGLTVATFECPEDGLFYRIGNTLHMDRDVIVGDDRLTLLASGIEVLL